MKKQLNEVKRMQKLAGIIGEGRYRSLSRYYDEPVPFPQTGMGPDPGEPEYVDPAQEAQNILDDLSAERDPMELAGMTPADALETVEAYGHTGQLAQEIADNLVALAGGMNENADMAKSDELKFEGEEVNEDYENQEVNKAYGALYKILDAAGFSDKKDYTLMHNAQRNPDIVYVVVRDPNLWPEINKTIRDAVQSGTVQFGKIEPKVIDFDWWKNKVLGEPMPPSKYGPDSGDDEEDFDEDELPPINKAELVSFIKQSGPKPTGAKPRGEFNVSLEYVDYPSIPDSYMTGARDVFMCVVKACGGKAKLEGRPGPEQNYTVMGCSFDAIQAVWKFLASDQTYENAGDSDTIVQANGCAQTWEINSDYDQGDEGDDEPVRPRDPNAPNFYDDPEGALKYYRSKKKY